VFEISCFRGMNPGKHNPLSIDKGLHKISGEPRVD